DRAHDFNVLSRLTDAADEGTVNLEDVHRETVQVAKRRVTSAEVIDAELHAEGFQPAQELRCRLGIFHHRALGNLQFQMPRIDVCFFQRPANLIDEGRLSQLLAGKVDAHEDLPVG